MMLMDQQENRLRGVVVVVGRVGGSEIDLTCTGELPSRWRGRSRRSDIYFTQDGQGTGGRGEAMVVNSKNVAVLHVGGGGRSSWPGLDRMEGRGGDCLCECPV